MGIFQPAMLVYGRVPQVPQIFLKEVKVSSFWSLDILAGPTSVQTLDDSDGPTSQREGFMCTISSQTKEI